MSESKELSYNFEIEVASLKIPDIEKDNIMQLHKIINRVSHGMGMKIELHVVGGAKEKEWPRKDIDISVEQLGSNEKPDILSSKKSFDKLSDMVEEVAKESDGLFIITKKVVPFADPEFGSGVVAHDGSIMLQPKVGTLIELVRKRNQKNYA